MKGELSVPVKGRLNPRIRLLFFATADDLALVNRPSLPHFVHHTGVRPSSRTHSLHRGQLRLEKKFSYGLNLPVFFPSVDDGLVKHPQNNLD